MKAVVDVNCRNHSRISGANLLLATGGTATLLGGGRAGKELANLLIRQEKPRCLHLGVILRLAFSSSLLGLGLEFLLIRGFVELARLAIFAIRLDQIGDARLPGSRDVDRAVGVLGGFFLTLLSAGSALFGDNVLGIRSGLLVRLDGVARTSGSARLDWLGSFATALGGSRLLLGGSGLLLGGSGLLLGGSGLLGGNLLF
jgi:hypothetical protein